MRVGVRRAGLRFGLLGLLVTSAVSLVFVGSAAAAGSVSFASAVDYGDGIIPGSVAVADLNGDGRPDLAAANPFAAVSVLLGNGDGTFQAKVDYETGTFPQSVAVADLNGDGKPDLAVASLGVDAVSVLLGNGDGTFQPKVDYGTGHFPRSVAVADLNGDGKPDLAVANSQGSGSFSGTVSVLLGNGDGTFQPKVDYDTGDGPYSVAAADLNGDGKPDLAVANNDQNTVGTVSVLLGNGDGTFQPKVDYDTGTPACGDKFCTNSQPASVAVADLNGDGKPDLAVANNGSSTVSVLLGNGDGTFQAHADYATGTFPVSVAVADLNGDGKPDLAVANNNPSGTVSVLLGNGDGTFQTKADFGTGRPVSVAAADLNGDGKPDLAYGNILDPAAGTGAVSVLLNTTDTVAPVVTIAPTPSDPSASAWYNASQLGTGGALPVEVTADDGLDGSGVASIDCTVDGVHRSSTSSPLEIKLFTSATAHTVSCTATDQAGNTSDPFPSSGPATFKVDTGPPSLGEPETFTTPHGDGGLWFNASDLRGVNHPLSVQALVSDGQSGLSSRGTSCSASKSVIGSLSEGEGRIALDLPDGVWPVRCGATDIAGNTASSGPVTFQIDTHPPTAAFSNCPSGGVPFGSTVSVDWTASDPIANPSLLMPGSGLASDPSGSIQLVTTVLGAGSVSSPAPVDVAGNTGNAATCGFTVVDPTPPTISASATIPDRAGGTLPYIAGTWTNQAVTVHYSCADTGGSMLASCTSDQVFTASGTTPSTSGSATDNAGNSASASFGPIMIDTVAPTLVVPGNIVVNATSPAGAKVSYLASAGDNSGGSGVASSSCAPVSGSLFPIGTTTVHCTASDNAGNTSTGSFTVHVSSASEQLSVLLGAVNGVSPGSALTSKLTQVQGYIAKNDKADACSGLSSFLGLVASQAGKKLTVAQANSFTAQANSIRATLGC